MIEQALALLAAYWILIAASILIVLLVVSRAARDATGTTLRVLSRPLLLVAVVALVWDGTRTLADASGIVTTSLLEHWQALAPSSLETTRTAITRRIAPFAWDPALLSVLRLPAWLILGGLGLALNYIGRKRHRVNVFAN